MFLDSFVCITGFTDSDSKHEWSGHEKPSKGKPQRLEKSHPYGSWNRGAGRAWSCERVYCSAFAGPLGGKPSVVSIAEGGSVAGGRRGRNGLRRCFRQAEQVWPTAVLPDRL